MIQEGYKKYRGGVFRVPTINGWMIVVSGASKVNDLRKATDEQVSIHEIFSEFLQAKYTISEKAHSDPYHEAIIRTHLNRHLESRFDDVKDETIHAFSELIPTTGEWSKVKVSEVALKMAARTINRLFVGAPIFTTDVAISAAIINLFPDLLKPLVGRYFTPAKQGLRRGVEHLGPLIQDHLDNAEKFGKDYPNKPNDMVSWLLDSAQGYQRTVHDLTPRILGLNLGAIHSTSTAFTQVLFALATYPEYIPELREEVETVIRGEGITKSTLLRLVKCDSFIKETLRVESMGSLTLNRKVLKDFTFSDGTFIPAGFYVAAPSAAMHRDEEIYTDAATFDGFRFLKRISEADGTNKHAAVALSLDYLIFGSGRHACPGRFFAVYEIKSFLAHVLMKYEFKLDPEYPNLRKLWFGQVFMLDPTATLLIRKRRVQVG